MSALTLKGISKRFGKVQVLKGIDLEVNHGEFCVLLGPSGCGKSTLLNVLAGLFKQEAGNILIDGQPVDHLSPRERDIAMVFQSYAEFRASNAEGPQTDDPGKDFGNRETVRD
jgi:ABC-type sugar transport system ATPase subunit